METNFSKIITKEGILLGVRKYLAKYTAPNSKEYGCIVYNIAGRGEMAVDNGNIIPDYTVEAPCVKRNAKKKRGRQSHSANKRRQRLMNSYLSAENNQLSF